MFSLNVIPSELLHSFNNTGDNTFPVLKSLRVWELSIRSFHFQAGDFTGLYCSLSCFITLIFFSL
jgi:hypothetical protein